MLVFIDESGDPGFKLDKGSSVLFVAAMVVFADHDEARRTDQAIRDAMQRLRVKPEFKFSKIDDERRDGFFEAVRNLDWRARAIIVEKERIYSPRFKTDKERFYDYFVRAMLTYDNGTLQRAKVIIDGSGDREFRKTLGSQLRRRLPPDRLAGVKFSDSRRDPLVQLADMVAGAIARSYRANRDDRLRWIDMIRHKIDDQWRFR